MNYIKSIDQLAKPYSFNIDGGTFRTVLGGLLSIVIIIGWLVAGWYFGRDIYEKLNPNFIYRQDILDYAEFIGSMRENHIIYAMKFSIDVDGTLIDDLSEIEHVGLNKMVYFNMTTNKTEIVPYVYSTLKDCDSSITNDTKSLKFLKGYKCLDPSYFVGGINEVGSAWYVYGFVKYCDSSTELRNPGLKCKPREKIIEKYKKYKKSYVNILYQKNILNPLDYSIPFKSTFYKDIIGVNTGDLVSTSLSYYKTVYVYNSNIQTDHGYVFEDTYNFTFTGVDYTEGSTQPAGNYFNGDFFFKYQVETSKRIDYSYRSYIKVPDIIANTGGFVSFGIYLIEFLYGFYVDSELLVYLYNKVFTLQIDENLTAPEKAVENIKINQKSSDIDISNISADENLKANSNDKSCLELNHIDKEVAQKRKPSLYQVVLKQNEDKKELVLNKEITKLIDYRSRKRKVVSITSSEKHYFRCCFCRNRITKDEKRLKYELMIAADAAIEQKTEILELWKTLDRIRLFEKLLVNESQFFMLQNRGLQLITNENYMSSSREIQKLEEIKFQRQVKKLQDYIETRRAEKKLSEIDSILMMYLSDEIKCLININT